jgi:hypothetical protein
MVTRVNGVKVENAFYFRAHSKAPRGTGSWAFCTVHPERADYLNHVIWKSGMFSDARKAAAAEALAKGVHTIYVCS